MLKKMETGGEEIQFAREGTDLVWNKISDWSAWRNLRSECGSSSVRRLTSGYRITICAFGKDISLCLEMKRWTKIGCWSKGEILCQGPKADIQEHGPTARRRKHDQKSLQALTLAKRNMKGRLALGLQIKRTHYVKVWAEWCCLMHAIDSRWSLRESKDKRLSRCYFVKIEVESSVPPGGMTLIWIYCISKLLLW